MKTKKLQFRIREFSQGGYAIDRKFFNLFWFPLQRQPDYGFDSLKEARFWLDSYVKLLEMEFVEENKPRYQEIKNYELNFNTRNFLWLQK
jgi:hypothetical protein